MDRQLHASVTVCFISDFSLQLPDPFKCVCLPESKPHKCPIGYCALLLVRNNSLGKTFTGLYGAYGKFPDSGVAKVDVNKVQTVGFKAAEAERSRSDMSLID